MKACTSAADTVLKSPGTECLRQAAPRPKRSDWPSSKRESRPCSTPAAKASPPPMRSTMPASSCGPADCSAPARSSRRADSVWCRYVRIASVAMDAPENMVLTHDRQAGAEAANYLESLGHKRIALVTGPKRYRSSIERGGGFTDALAKRGVELPAELVYEGGYTFESGVAGAEALLARSPRPTAIFACNDEMAAGIYKAALRMGLSIPGDLSVVGYDDSPLASQLWPSLTTIRLPVRDLGRQAAAMLLADNWPRAAQAEAGVSVSPHLVVRDSCQPPKH